ncbi:alpha/beta hydrolase [Cellulomonas sp. APG4]|uniref:alpha/beta fold hydrolase n=1 Tax=Cellulomonas sp. APG4 TaxID=1538656 RepID=UPI00137ABAEE|nr:alpha/beta hydrolase [Cellulomonas sp. APG4]
MSGPLAMGLVEHVAWTGYGPLDASAVPVLLVHGVTDSGECWPGVVAHLTAAPVPRAVVAIDARGHGRSGLPDEPFTIDALAAEAAAVVREVIGRPALVVGHSMGGLTAQRLAATAPELVAGLVLEDPAWVRERPTTPTGAPAWLAGALAEWSAVPLDELVARSRTAQPGWPDEEHEPWARSAQQASLRLLELEHRWFPEDAETWPDALAQVQVPVTLVTGDPARGAIVDPGQVARAAEVLGEAPHGRLIHVHVPSAGHNVRRDAPDAFLATLDTALAAS